MPRRGNDCPLPAEHHSLDASGRGTNLGSPYARTNLLSAVSTTSYNANNQLTKWGSANLKYDYNGNLTSGGGNTYTWDVRNRLTSITAGKTTIGTFKYDGVSLRRIGTSGKRSTTSSGKQKPLQFATISSPGGSLGRHNRGIPANTER
jgi:hypothetical protein